MRSFAFALTVAALGAGGCATIGATVSSGTARTTLHQGERIGNLEGVRRVHRVSDWLYSGGAPKGRLGLESLKALGVKTVISVDYDPVPKAVAETLGMRYLQFSYDYAASSIA